MTAPEASPIDLAGRAVEDLRELVKAEFAFARREFHEELQAMRLPALCLCGGIAVALLGAHLLLDAMAVRRPRKAVRWGAALLASGGALGVVGGMGLPRKPLARTKERLEADAQVAAEALS